MPAWSAHPPLDRATTGSRRCSGDHPRGRTMSITNERVIDQEVLDEFMGRFVQELGAASQVPTVIIGDRLGLYRALDEVGPCTSAELATATGTHERYVREWLRGQAAGGYVSYDPETDEYYLTRRAVLHVGSTGQSGIHPGCLPDGGGDRPSRACHHRGVHHRRRIRLAPTSSRPLRGRRALLSARLLRQPGVLLAAGARRCGREADRRGSGRRRGLRSWRLHDLDGSGLPEVTVHRLRLPRAVDRARHPAGG